MIQQTIFYRRFFLCFFDGDRDRERFDLLELPLPLSSLSELDSDSEFLSLLLLELEPLVLFSPALLLETPDFRRSLLLDLDLEELDDPRPLRRFLLLLLLLLFLSEEGESLLEAREESFRPSSLSKSPTKFPA